jgi:CelD/BcsL family acetyltransferase involved in cellulose biosynthesis
MHVVRFTTLDGRPWLAEAWDRLAQGMPFRGWAWSSCWWRHYGADRRGGKELYVLGVMDGPERLAAVAPWYIKRSASRGRVLRFLGSGEVCSDYVSVLCLPGDEAAVSEALADWLFQAQRRRRAAGDCDGWDLLDLGGADGEDRAVGCLAGALEARRSVVHRRPGLRSWRVRLPPTWPGYLALLSKDHRKQVRRVEKRWLEPARAVLRTVECRAQLDRGERILIDLHQRRHNALGQPGCFRSPRYAAFHHEVLPELLDRGQLQLHWIERDGRPVAAEYHLAGQAAMYAYQSGIDPQALADGPGTLAHVATLRRAIDLGFQEFDFLRGDEPYKAHWRAQPREILQAEVVPPRIGARLRHGLWRAGRGMKRWAQSR